MKIKRSKLIQLLFLSLLILLEILVASFLCFQKQGINVDESLIFASWMCTIVFPLLVISWYKLSHEIICPYTIFLLVLFVFACGQGVGWSLGFDMGSRDLWNRVDHGLNRTILLKGLLYSIISITAFHFGAVIAYTGRVSNKAQLNAESVVCAYKRLGKLMGIIAVPAFMAKSAINLLAVNSGGYGNYYDVNASMGTVGTILGIIANWYSPCMLILLIAYRDNKKYCNIFLTAMFTEVIVALLVGGRSGAVMTMLGMLLAFHYFIRPIRKKDMIVGAGVAYLGMAVLNAIATFRNLMNRSLGDLVELTVSSLGNAVGELLGELGWTLTSICWTMELVPSDYPYRYGMTYLASLTTAIPSSFFGGRANHPVVIWAHLAEWLQGALNKSYGPGFSMIAEAYINYGGMGIVMMAIVGFLIAKYLTRVSRKDAEINLIGSTFQILFIMTIMKSLVRSSVSVAFRDVFFVLLPLYLLIRLSIKGKKSMNGGIQ